MQGVVVSVEKDGVMAKVDMACGPYRVVSLMSREAAEELELAPGVLGHRRREVDHGHSRTPVSDLPRRRT